MKVPCEVLVKTVLPTVRMEIVKNLVDEYHLSQRHAARLMGLTAAAVSQYMSQKRATSRDLEIFKSADFSALVKETTARIAKNQGSIELMRAICDLCNHIRKSGLLCVLHQDSSLESKGCSFCKQPVSDK